MRVLVVGGGAREHVIGKALCRRSNVELFVVSSNHNQGLAALSGSSRYGRIHECDVVAICRWVAAKGIDLAVIGAEGPLDAGLSDALSELGIPTLGPSRNAARIETSKWFARDLLRRYDVAGQVDYEYFTDVGSLRRFLSTSDKLYAIKPVGLTNGKGVRLMGEHLHSLADAIAYGESMIRDGVIIEERLFGREFSLQAFVDGKTVIPMPLVCDFKRAFEGDCGPNTGSMGSYSRSDGLLSFAGGRGRDEAMVILRSVVRALAADGCPYHGIMYGQFMATSDGVKLVEINARFGDPEALNVLALLETDLVDVCMAVIDGSLRAADVRFSRRATVCKYVTPVGYGHQPMAGAQLFVDRARIEALGVDIFFAKVDTVGQALLTTTSRAFALLAVAASVSEAESAVEQALAYVHGEYHVRHDIGKVSTQ